jgi:hypothetical protein
VSELVERIPGYRGKFKTFAALNLSPEISINSKNSRADPLKSTLLEMCDAYHKESFENENTRKGGGIKYGFGRHALPVVLYSNAPNNSFFLLWLDRRSYVGGPDFKGLFRRMERHRLR